MADTLEPGAPAAAAPEARTASHLAELNDEQLEAVEATEGPVLVLAGAGTGKTRVLTTRLAHILVTGRAAPGEILAVTFTNKAAREMVERVERLVGHGTAGMWLGTFHAMGARLLRRHADLVGLNANFTIIDTDDQLRLARQVLSANNIDEKRWPARTLLWHIDRWKDRGLAPQSVGAEEASDFADGRARDLYRQYQERLASFNAADFGDLLLHCVTLFTAHRDLLKDYQRRFKYILVDEYQDTNVAQYLWLRLLAQGRRNICCVGDDDQSIYGWRGAEVGNILRFEHDFPGARVIRLERNYRSTTDILGAASGLIAHNAGRLGKTLWTDLAGGEKVVVRGVWDEQEEARAVGEAIEALNGQGHALGEIAVLIRAGFQTRAFEERFMTIGVPYRVIGGLRFYERREIRDAVAYLRVTAQADDNLAFERIVNLPKRGLGDASSRVLHRVARHHGWPLTRAARLVVETDELKPQQRTALRRVIESFDRWRAMLDALPPAEVTETILDESGYTEMWQRDKSVTAPGRLENLKELVRAVAEFETLQGFLEHVSLVMETDELEDDDMVNLMTLHSAKGLEFDTVFLPGWEEGLFPHQLALDESGLKGLEEERRLAHVGLTRARKRAQVLFAANRAIHGQWQSGQPSRFIDELPAEHIVRTDAFGLPTGLQDQGETWAFAPARHSATARDGAAERPALGRRQSNYYRVVEAHARRVSGGTDLVRAVSHPEGTFQVGTRVFHQKFGYGLVRAVDGDKLEVAFDKAGLKKVIDSFVTPA